MLLSFLIERPSLVGIRVQVDVDSDDAFEHFLNGRQGTIDEIARGDRARIIQRGYRKFIEAVDNEVFVRVKLDTIQAQGSGYVQYEEHPGYWLLPNELRTL